MKIINLIEDTQGTEGLHAEHGLSIYIETSRHKILVDTGASEKTWENAERLGVRPEEIDTVFLSHGHYDHSGGILSFSKINPNARICLHQSAGFAYYNLRDNREKYIGIDAEILQLPQCIFLQAGYRVDEEISVFGDVTGRRKWPGSNLTLKRKEGNRFVQDSFDHEQYIVVEEQGRKVLLSGCAHNGILNILDRYGELYGGRPDIVISGFHMMKKEPYDEKDIAVIRDIGEELSGMDTLFYTGHCTGMQAFHIMKESMGDQLQYMHAGDRIL